MSLFEAQSSQGRGKADVIEMKYPEWFSALLELTGVAGFIDNVREDRLRR